MAKNLDLVIEKGKTFRYDIKWETDVHAYSPITGITQDAPVVVTSTAHGIVDGWRVAIVSVKGMTQINAEGDTPRASEYHRASVTNLNSVTFNDINSSTYKPYISGGFLQYFPPVDITNYSARMDIRDKIGGTLLQALDSATGGILIDTEIMTITIIIPAATTSAITYSKGVYDLELINPVTGVVTALIAGKVTVTNEVTTSS